MDKNTADKKACLLIAHLTNELVHLADASGQDRNEFVLKIAIAFMDACLIGDYSRYEVLSEEEMAKVDAEMIEEADNA